MFEVKVHTGSECQWRNIVPLQPEGFKGQSPDELEALKQSITQNGFHDAFDVWQHNNTLFSIDGVHRKIALLALESEGVQIPETLPCTYIQAKDKKEATLILMSRNITYSHIVSTAALFDAVAMDAEVMLPIVPEKQKELFREADNYIAGEEIDYEEQGEEKYNKSIKSPIYEITKDKPPLNELANTARYDALLSDIEAMNVPEGEKHFLRLAATRHIVFDYGKIAEYYAHSDKNMQIGMENSALVIIDFNKAVELGFVKLTEAIMQQIAIDYEA